MAKRNVKCPYCGNSFDADSEPYVKSGNRYYHECCHIEKEKNDSAKNEIHGYMKNKLGLEYSKSKIDRQISKYMEEGITPTQIILTLKYWYDIKKSSTDKANGGIGIVGYVLHDAESYYKTKNENLNRNKNIDMDNFIMESREYTIRADVKFRKPKRTSFFDLK